MYFDLINLIKFFAHNFQNQMNSTTSGSDDDIDSVETTPAMVERRAVRDTNWRRRQHALTQLEKMLTCVIEEEILEIIALSTELLVLYSFLSRFFLHNNIRVTEIVISIQEHITNILLMLYADIEEKTKEITNIMYMEPYVLAPQPPLQNRFLNEITDEWSRLYTRFTIAELRRLFLHLRVPLEFVLPINSYDRRLCGETVFLISLVYTAHAFPLYTMSNIFGGCPRLFGSYYKLFTRHIYNTFYHRISGDSLRFFVP